MPWSKTIVAIGLKTLISAVLCLRSSNKTGTGTCRGGIIQRFQSCFQESVPGLFLCFGLPILFSLASPSMAQSQTPLGHDAKIRLGWTQWWHWNDETVPTRGTPLLDALANVGFNVFADWSPNEEMGRHARRLGIRYYGVVATAKLRGPAEQQKCRLAVDRYGLTCPEQFEKFKAAGGDIHAG